MTFRRTAAAECDLAGQRIRAGEKIVVSFTSANGDEAVFPGADRFDIRRRPTRTWYSATARTSASAPTSPAARCARCRRRC